MKKRAKMNNGLGSLLILVLCLAFMAVPSFSEGGEYVVKAKQYRIPGLNGELNNLIEVFGRYLCVAPYFPSLDADEEGEYALREMDNHFVYVVNMEKLGKIRRLDLGNLYWPESLFYDETRQRLYVRGTTYPVNAEGEIEEEDAVAVLSLQLDENEKPVAEQAVNIEVPGDGASGDDLAMSPRDVHLAYGGRMLILTDGHSVFVYNVVEGYVYQVDFGADIMDLSYHDGSRTLVVATRTEVSGDGEEKHNVDYVFAYKVKDNGVLDLIRRSRFEDGMGFLRGSGVALSVDPESSEVESVYFVGTLGADGIICHVNLQSSEGGIDGVVEKSGELSEWKDLGLDSSNPVPMEVSFDRESRVLSIVRKGGFWDIRRPSLGRRGRPGRIRRPSLVRISGPSAFVVAQLDKKNRLVGYRVFADGFADKGGLSNLVAVDDRHYVFSTYTGELYLADKGADGIEQATVRLMGSMGDSRVDRLSPGLAEMSYFGISSLDVGGEGIGGERRESGIIFARVKKVVEGQ